MTRAIAFRAAMLALLAFALFGHSGGLDAYGGHNDRKAGNYHFHNGPLKNQAFASKADALKALSAASNAAAPAPATQSATSCPEINHRPGTVCVKYRGTVPLDSFTCTSVDRSSVVKRVCYDPKTRYMVINLTGTYYHYCEIDAKTVQGLLSAPSMGAFYNARIKSRGGDGPFDCRTHRIPQY